MQKFKDWREGGDHGTTDGMDSRAALPRNSMKPLNYCQAEQQLFRRQYCLSSFTNHQRTPWSTFKDKLLNATNCSASAGNGSIEERKPQLR